MWIEVCSKCFYLLNKTKIWTSLYDLQLYIHMPIFMYWQLKFIKDTIQTIMNIRSLYFSIDENNKLLIKCSMFPCISKAALIELSLMVEIFNMWIKKVERNARIIIILISKFFTEESTMERGKRQSRRPHIFFSILKNMKQKEEMVMWWS